MKGVKIKMLKRRKAKKKKKISVSSGKAKGRACQQWAVKKISDLIGLPWGADEQIASRESGQPGVDVRLVGDALEQFPWSVECKWQESWSVPAAIKQAKNNQMNGTDWLLILKKNHHDFIAVLDGEVFFDLLRLIHGRRKGR